MSELSNHQKRRAAIEYLASQPSVSEEEAEEIIKQFEGDASPSQRGDLGFSKLLKREKMLHLLSSAIDSTSEMVIITDAREQIGDEKIIYVNDGVTNVTGYSKEELIGANPKILQGPDTNTETLAHLREQLAAGNHFEGETFNYRKDGSRYRVRWNIDPIRNESGEITHFVSVQRDVTSQWKQKKKLEVMVEERDSLLNEIHHRVKNNLAVITGLLDLQAAKSGSEETQIILSESINRIQSIATLHEKLYQTGDFRNILLPKYLSELIDHLIDTMSSDKLQITAHTDIADATLPVTEAVPLALILNELITNSFKHGFEDRAESTLWITLNHDSGHFHLTVADDGVGLPEDLEIEELNSLGLRLIDTLCSQLGAEYSFENREPTGTEFILEFEVSNGEYH